MSQHELLIALLGFLGVIITQWTMFIIQWRTSRRVDEINDAVNHRHTKPGAKKLYDLVLENHNKAESLELWNMKQDEKISILTVKVDSLPCYLREMPECPEDKR